VLEGDIGKLLAERLGVDHRTWPSLASLETGGHGWNLAMFQIGSQGDGVLVAGAHRVGFPTQAERLLLNVTAHHVAMGLQEARILDMQRRTSEELDRRVAQRTSELQRSEALLRETQQLSSTGSFTCRPNTGEVTWSEQTYRIFGIAPGTHVDISLMDERIHPEDNTTFAQQLGRAHGCATGVDFDGRLEMDDGTLQYVHVVARANRDDRLDVEYTGSIQNVTDRRLAQESLAKASTELAHVARITTLEVLAATIAHEVNQPLSGVLTNANTCLRMLASDPANTQGAVIAAQRLLRDGSRAAEVIRRLRELIGKRTSLTELVDLNDAAKEVIALSRMELQCNQVIIRTDFTEPLPPVRGDRLQLQQVMLNLVRNASDAMKTIEGTPRHLLVRTDLPGNGCVRLGVRDSGEGFRANFPDRIFEPFYTTKADGLGIGLSVSRSIIEHHDGQLWATANEGPGATFWFSIPAGVAVDNLPLMESSPT
jgi:C4-dicarboxylate-specific signal transduction histidine kinase